MVFSSISTILRSKIWIALVAQSVLTSSDYTKPLLEIGSDKMLVGTWAWLHNRLGLDHVCTHFRVISVVFGQVSITFFSGNKNGMIWRHSLEHTVLLFRRFPVWYISSVPNHLSVTQSSFWAICSSVTPKWITFLKRAENSTQKLCFGGFLMILKSQSRKYQKNFFFIQKKKLSRA